MNEQVHEREFDSLLEYLRRSRGFDFSAYKRPSLIRRVQKRMQAIPISGFAAYTDYLEVHPDEFAQLFNVILINVTSFFRDPEAWDALRTQVMERVLAGRSPGEPVRVWTAGCASGEETYSLAMLLAEALGRGPFRDRVKIYATDVDEHALNQARQASYTEKQIAAVPAELRDRYFVKEAERFVFDRDLRRSVIFGRHDLVQDAPISRVNLLVCRNALMYFNTEAQGRIMARFHFALADGGILFLGKAEMLLSQSQTFSPVDLRRRIFMKVETRGWRERMTAMQQATDEPFGDAPPEPDLGRAAFDAGPVAQIVVDQAGLLALYNDRARALFNLADADAGRPLQDLELSYRPVELRGPIEQSREQHRPVVLKEHEWEIAGRPPMFVDVHVVPLFDHAGRWTGASIAFADVSRQQDLQAQLARSRQDLETAYEELQSTNEELETTNEELQSTVEELETTNEELQSTNEELETMNEELQSTNEELQAINEELRDRSVDLDRANGFLASVLTSVRQGIAVVDRELRVMSWNRRSEDLWGVRADEAVGQNLLNLDIGLPLDRVRTGVRVCLTGDSESWDTTVPATNRRGRSIECRVSCMPLVGADHEVTGAIVMIEDLSAAGHA